MMQEMMFEETLYRAGVNPDLMNERDFRKMFKEFKAHMRAQTHRPPPARPEPAPAEPKPSQSRLKDLYRLLVRRLHPDTRADSDAEVSAIWHDVQEAYWIGNVERLEMLLALSDLQADAFGEQTSLAQMRSVLAELRRSLQALQRNLRDAKKDPAWNFAHRPDRPALEKRMRHDLEIAIADGESHLKQLEVQIAKWAAPPKNRRPDRSGRQMDFFS